MYYVNDGMYQSFNIVKLDGLTPDLKPIIRNGLYVGGESTGKLLETTVWGPSSNDNDCLGSVMLPEMKTGDWLCVDDMGSYSGCADSEFCGFEKTMVIYSDQL